MSTYNVSFSLATAQTGVSGHYPLLIKNSTYIPSSTIYVKTGDIVQYTVTEPEGGTVSYNNTTVSDTDPDPLVFTNFGTAVQNSGSIWNHVVQSGTDDAVFDWYWFSQTVHSSGSGRKYSQRVRTRRVIASPKMNGATSAITVNPGNTITFSAPDIAGLDAATTNGNCLYFSIFNSGGSLVNPTSYTSGGWDSSSNQLGKIHTSDNSTVLTLGSNFPTGTYSVFLTHFNAADSPTGNDFYGSENRLGADGVMGNSASALQFTVEASSATGPTAFDSGLGSDKTNVPVNTQVESSTTTISGMNPSPLTVTPSGPGAGVSVNGATATNQTVSISNGDTVKLTFNASGSANTPVTGTLTINGVTGSVTATTAAAGGGSSTSGSGDYGFAVTNGTNTIFGGDVKAGHVIAASTWSAAGFGNSGSIAVEGMTSSNRDTVGVILLSTQQFIGFTINISYGNGSFVVQNNSATAVSGSYIALRY